jgi:hypothetical protein
VLTKIRGRTWRVKRPNEENAKGLYIRLNVDSTSDLNGFSRQRERGREGEREGEGHRESGCGEAKVSVERKRFHKERFHRQP